MDNQKTFLLDLFFPKFCLGCQKEGSFLCEDCRSLLEILEWDYCLCSHGLHSIPGKTDKGKCPKCSPKKLAGLYFAVSFKNPLAKKLIHQFKYEPYTKSLAKTLASLLIEHFVLTKKNTNEIWQNSVLVPVPVDNKKLKIRDYNQSEELAKELSNVLEIPMIPDCLIKTKATAPQMELSKIEREGNLIGAFEIINPEKIYNKKIFLVDDVYTTGSTMEECAKTLRQAGAKSVWGICIAREE